MKHFKSQDGDIFAFESDGSQDFLISVDMVEMSAAEIDAHLNPPPTQEEIASAAKLTGIEFEGVMCSATRYDQSGLLAVKEFVAAGQSTVFEFENGNELRLTPQNLAAFQAVWMPFRASFFKS